MDPTRGPIFFPKDGKAPPVGRNPVLSEFYVQSTRLHRYATLEARKSHHQPNRAEERLRSGTRALLDQPHCIARFPSNSLPTFRIRPKTLPFDTQFPIGSFSSQNPPNECDWAPKNSLAISGTQPTAPPTARGFVCSLERLGRLAAFLYHKSWQSSHTITQDIDDFHLRQFSNYGQCLQARKRQKKRPTTSLFFFLPNLFSSCSFLHSSRCLLPGHNSQLYCI